MKTDPVPARAAAYCAIYPRLLQIAQDHGYALTVHGSVHRDLDLVAIPWVEEASEPLELITAMKEITRTVTHHPDTDHLSPDCAPTIKPHGRVAYSLHVTDRGMYGGYFDISVMPKIIKQEPLIPPSQGSPARPAGSPRRGRSTKTSRGRSSARSAAAGSTQSASASAA
jgi:hypothetical protein